MPLIRHFYNACSLDSDTVQIKERVRTASRHHSPMRTPKRKLAIFDIDGTVFRSSLLIEVFHALVASRVFSKRAADQVQRHYMRWLNRKGHYDDYLMTLVRVYYRELKGKRVDDVERVIARVVHEHRDRVYRYTRDLITDLGNKRYMLLAISNSPDATVRLFSKSAGFHGALGRRLEEKNGRYTGWCLYDGERFPVDMKLNKPGMLQSYLKEHHIDADLRQSIAVGDSEGDLDILSIVGTPIAFNPSYELGRIAQRKKWKIVVERKDVMYHINDAHLSVSRERPNEQAKF